MNSKYRYTLNALLMNLYRVWSMGEERLIININKKQFGPATKGKPTLLDANGKVLKWGEPARKEGVYFKLKDKGFTFKIFTALLVGFEGKKKVIPGLVPSGYLDLCKGSSQNNGKYRFSSTVTILPKLADYFASLPLIESEHEWVPVVLKNIHGQELNLEHEGFRGEEQAYLDEVTATMIRYHDFMQDVEFEYKPPLGLSFFYEEPPDFDIRGLTATYKERLSEGGRMFRAFFSKSPKNQRVWIKINNEWCTEIDFDHFFITLLYYEADIPVPELPYLFEEDGTIETERKRDCCKIITQTIINCGDKSGRTAAERRSDVIRAYQEPYRYPKTDKERAGQLKSEYYEDCPFTYEELKDIVMQLEEKHQAITLYDDQWGRLQKAESDLMRSIMDRCMDEGIAILPIHDSVVCAMSTQHRVMEIMEDLCPFPFSVKDLDNRRKGIKADLQLMVDHINRNEGKVDSLEANSGKYNGFYWKHLRYLTKNPSISDWKTLEPSIIPWNFHEVKIPEKLTEWHRQGLKHGAVWIVDKFKGQKAVLARQWWPGTITVEEYNKAIRDEDLKPGEVPKALGKWIKDRSGRRRFVNDYFKNRPTSLSIKFPYRKMVEQIEIETDSTVRKEEYTETDYGLVPVNIPF